MKKLIAILLALVLLVGLTACGAAPAQTQTPATAEPVTEPAAEPTAEPEKTFVVGICQLTQHPALDAATEGFMAALTELLGERVVFEERNASNDSQTCSVICNQFVSDEVDLIMANATPALLAAASATNEIPIIGTSISDFGSTLDIADWTGATGMNISGTSDLAPLDGQAAMLRELFPDAVKVGLLYCSGESNSLFQAKEVRAQLEALGCTVTDYAFADSNDVSAVTAMACSESEVLYIPTDNTAASCAEVINNVALNAGVPIIAGEEGICRGCGVATLSISYFDIGFTAGEMAFEVLENGADISEMKIRFAPQFTKEFNASICQTLGVTVPDGYIAIPKT